MKSFLKLFTTSVVGGFFVLLPVAVIVLVILQIDQTIVDLVTPVAELFPNATIGGVQVAVLLAILLIVAVCFLTGWFVQTTVGRKIQSGIDNTLLGRIPGFSILKKLTGRFAGDKAGDSRFAPAVFSIADGVKVVGLITEEHNNYYAIYVPLAPTPGVGTLQFVRKDKVRRLDIPVSAVFNAYGQWGVGSASLMGRDDSGA